MYRSVALYCIRKGADTEKEEEVIKYLPEINLDIVLKKGIQKIKVLPIYKVTGGNPTDDRMESSARKRKRQRERRRKERKQV